MVFGVWWYSIELFYAFSREDRLKTTSVCDVQNFNIAGTFGAWSSLECWRVTRVPFIQDDVLERLQTSTVSIVYACLYMYIFHFLQVFIHV